MVAFITLRGSVPALDDGVGELVNHLSRRRATMAKEGAYLVKILVGNKGTPGAPLLHFTGVVNAPTGKINGFAEITQALPPPHGVTDIPNVTGQIRHTGFGPDKLLVTLSGSYVVSVPPPAIGSYLAHFEAFLVLDSSWKGTGSFSYNGHEIKDVPVENEDG
ncbi:DUF1842 domain-containing protein [Lichenibacterium dinghuense]|uniref:DUF1842 domain-containing protein n=1 Tax=Lichenibacterium dinghuense TaxID=2895977 RepID=UPI001F2CE5CC|nr:DUF1842 domain-containing protein [Lichenibacterium sp. 6Y81]